MCNCCELYAYEKEQAKIFKKKSNVNVHFGACLYVWFTKNHHCCGATTHKHMKLNET